MKKTISIILSTCLSLATALSAFGANGTIVNGKTMVPVRGVFEQLGFTVSWDSNTETATIYNNKSTIEIPKDKTYFYANGDLLEPDVPQQVIDGSLYIPLRAISDSINADISWDGEQKIAHISYDGNDVYVNCSDTPFKSKSTENVKTYTNYPNVPDLGSFMGIEEVSVFNGTSGTIYAYFFMDIKIDMLNDYISTLEQNGFVEMPEMASNASEKVGERVWLNKESNTLLALTYWSDKAEFDVAIVQK